MALKKWHELPVSLRRSEAKRWDYLVDELSSGDATPEPEQQQEETPVTRDISITVDDGTDPIQGASVVIGETTKTTDSSGECSFTGLTDGEKSVTVSADGYTEKTETITVSSEGLSFTISLEAEVEETPVTRDISITVDDGTDAVEGATVAIGDITGTTGSAGGCTLQGVADGEQTISVTVTGFDDYSGTITVSENDTSFTISLTAATPGEQQETPGQ